MSDGVTSFVVPRMPPGHYYVNAQCAGQALPCCELDVSRSRTGWFEVKDAPDTSVAPPSPVTNGSPAPILLLVLAGAAGAALWLRRNTAGDDRRL